MSQFFAGTSGWAYPSWKPAFYPEKLAQKNFLNYYASRLNTVEVNFSFRQLLKDSTVQKWIAETPEHFRFGIKAHQVITHIKRLKDTDEFVKRFLGTLENLAHAKKLGPVLFQLPPNLKSDRDLLQTFLDSLPKGLHAAFEFRHPSWLADETYETLRSHNVALCVAETEERAIPDVVTADFCYYRFRKPTYTPEERNAMVGRIREHLAQNRDIFAYFKHEETPEGALYAVEVAKSIAA
jgi:uncharacterized protein YecE (DUF72 family)